MQKTGKENPNFKHGLCNHRLYSIYYTMRSRCLNQQNLKYKDWGGRGINICSDWMDDFLSFYSWSIANGYDDNLQIDRIKNNKGYYPKNCRWVTPAEQSFNRRNNKLTQDIANKIRKERVNKNLSYRQLAKKHSISFQMVSKIITNKSWIETQFCGLKDRKNRQ